MNPYRNAHHYGWKGVHRPNTEKPELSRTHHGHEVKEVMRQLLFVDALPEVRDYCARELIDLFAIDPQAAWTTQCQHWCASRFIRDLLHNYECGRRPIMVRALVQCYLTQPIAVQYHAWKIQCKELPRRNPTPNLPTVTAAAAPPPPHPTVQPLPRDDPRVIQVQHQLMHALLEQKNEPHARAWFERIVRMNQEVEGKKKMYTRDVHLEKRCFLYALWEIVRRVAPDDDWLQRDYLWKMFEHDPKHTHLLWHALLSLSEPHELITEEEWRDYRLTPHYTDAYDDDPMVRITADWVGMDPISFPSLRHQGKKQKDARKRKSSDYVYNTLDEAWHIEKKWRVETEQADTWMMDVSTPEGEERRVMLRPSTSPLRSQLDQIKRLVGLESELIYRWRWKNKVYDASTPLGLSVHRLSTRVPTALDEERLYQPRVTFSPGPQAQFPPHSLWVWLTHSLGVDTQLVRQRTSELGVRETPILAPTTTTTHLAFTNSHRFIAMVWLERLEPYRNHELVARCMTLLSQMQE